MTPAMRTCPHHARDTSAGCPGCPLLDLSSEAQHEQKRALVAEALAPYAVLSELKHLPIGVASPNFGYRTRAKWRIGRGGAIGLYALGSHDVVDLPDCGVVRPSIAAAGQALRTLLREGTPDWLKSTEDGGALSGVDLREVLDETSRSEVLAMLVLDRDVPLRELELFAPRWRALCPEIVSIAAHRRHQSHTLLGGVTQSLVGPLERLDRISAAAPPFLATHGAFVQAHRPVAAAMMEAIAAGIAERAPPGGVLELFAGSGALSLLLARAGRSVLAVESFGPAMERLRRAAQDASLEEKIRPIAHDATVVAIDLARKRQEFAAVVVNPPRTGLRPELRAHLPLLGASVVYYVSCEPRTLARDLADLSLRGLVPTSAAPFDMMPQTSQVETLVELRRGPRPRGALRVLFRDETLVAVDKPPHLPTTPHPEHPICLLELVREETGLSDATPVHRLDAGTSGVCLFAARPEDVAPLASALSAGDKRYLALVRGVPHKKGKIARPLKEGGRTLEAVTRYTSLELVGGHALLEVRPVEGRTHQIRRHLSSIDRPVLGDVRYGHAPSNVHLYERFGLDRPFLHVRSIELERSAGAVRIESPLSADLEAVLGGLRRSRP